MLIRKLRLEKGWSQEQLAEFSDLSVRTIQRLERGKTASLESIKSLAAVFDLDIQQLQEQTVMNSKVDINQSESEAIEYVRDIKGFYSHLTTYLLTITLLFLINYFAMPEYIWAWWAALGWGMGILSHGLSVFEVFNFFGPEWEKKQIAKRLAKQKQ